MKNSVSSGLFITLMTDKEVLSFSITKLKVYPVSSCSTNGIGASTGNTDGDINNGSDTSIGAPNNNGGGASTGGGKSPNGGGFGKIESVEVGDQLGGK